VNSSSASPGALSCSGATNVTSHVSNWADRLDGERYWHQAVGWPSWSSGCAQLVHCGATVYRDNLPAPEEFAFTNPYADFDVVFVERSSPTDACPDPCTNASVTVSAGSSSQIPPSSLGYYFAYTSGPNPASSDWGDTCEVGMWPDGVLPPFIVETP
jgi:hypothetical protein